MIKKFTKAIVRKPCLEMVNGISNAGLGKPDYEKALIQHNNYSGVLRECGLDVTVLESDSNFPDSTFVEDVALCTSAFAVITNPGAPSRKGEIEGIKDTIKKFYKNIEAIESPGTLEAGDVMMVGNHFYIGISERTNHHGAVQLINILEKYGMTGSKVPLKNILHLKTGLSYLENNNLLISGEFLNNPDFEKYNKIIVDEDEAYAACSLWVNGKVIVPEGYSETRKKIEKAGYTTMETDVSEFRKLDGGLSCLSLRF